MFNIKKKQLLSNFQLDMFGLILKIKIYKN
jgi:hypothetical protein